MSDTADPLREERLGADDVEIIERRSAYRGFFGLDVMRLRHRRFDGRWSRELVRELFDIREAVCVLPYDPTTDRVVLIEQFRVGALNHETGPWLLECVAGLRDPGEAPIETAKREVVEETGLEPGRIEAIGTYVASPGAVSERATMYVAEVDSTGAGGVHGLDHEGEDIRTHVVDADEAFRLIDEGRIVAANALLPLRWLEGRRDGLRERWRR